MIRNGGLYKHFKGETYMVYCKAFSNESMYRDKRLQTVLRARHSKNVKLLTLAFGPAYDPLLNPVLYFDPEEAPFGHGFEVHVVYFHYDGQSIVDPREPVMGMKWWMRPLDSFEDTVEINRGLDVEPLQKPRFEFLNQQVDIKHPIYRK